MDSPGSHPPRSDGPQGVVAGPAAPEPVSEEPVLCSAQTHPCSPRHRSLERFQGDAAVHSPVTATIQVAARAPSGETHILIIFSPVTQSNVSKNPGCIPGTTPGICSGRKLSFRRHLCLVVSTAPQGCQVAWRVSSPHPGPHPALRPQGSFSCQRGRRCPLCVSGRALRYAPSGWILRMLTASRNLPVCLSCC